MKIKILYLLVCVMYPTRTMEQDQEQLESVTVYEETVTDLTNPAHIVIFEKKFTNLQLLKKKSDLLLEECGLLSISADIHWMIFEFLSEDETFVKAVANMKALARTCKQFWQVFSNEKLNGKVIVKWEKRTRDEKTKLDEASLYWRFFMMANKLQNSGALQWFSSQKNNEKIATKINDMTSVQHALLKDALIKLAGGLTVTEYKLFDKRPIKVLELREFGMPVPSCIMLSLKTFSLRSLAGIEKVPDLTSVENLNLSGNYLTHIDEALIKRLTNLTRIDFAHNNLLAVNLDAFAELPSLQSLDFYCNQIEEISCNVPFKNTGLGSINFAFNQIKNLDPKIFTRFQARSIDLSNNPLKNRQEIRAISKPVTNRIMLDG